MVNRARDILRSNRSSFTRNASTSFHSSGATPHGAYPKRPQLAGASRYANVRPKEVCKTVVLLENSDSSNEYPLTHDMVMCCAEVDFLTTDDEQLVRDKIVDALKTQLPDIAPDDLEFVKVHNKRVTTPVVADGYNWDFKHVKDLCGQGKLYVRLVGNMQMRGAFSDREADRKGLPEEPEVIPVEVSRTIPEQCENTSAVHVGSVTNTEEPVLRSVTDDQVFIYFKLSVLFY